MNLADITAKDNASRQHSHNEDLNALKARLEREGHDIDALLTQIQAFEVAVPSWALGTGGTRFGRFPGMGEPRNVFEKMDDISVIQALTRGTPKVSLHIPWDEPQDPAALRDHAAACGLSFDAVNSNTFQDQPGAHYSYKFGSFSHVDAAVRDQAIEHACHVVDVGKTLGSTEITVWLADGANYPGQMSLRKSFQRVLSGLQEVYKHMPSDWRLFTEHKPYEPAFYATVVQDWGSSLMLAQALGERAACLVDLGHHLPNTNIEMIVARLVEAGKLGGFHFNDSKYGDDDLTTGSIKPYQLFLVFHELVDAARSKAWSSAPAYMIDQSHNVKDPIEALLQTVMTLQATYARALLVPSDALAAFQEENDVMMAEQTLRHAYETDMRPLVAEARRLAGGAIDPIHAFRRSDYREKMGMAREQGSYTPPASL